MKLLLCYCLCDIVEDVTDTSCWIFMPREIVTVQLGQCGNQSISHQSIYLECNLTF